MPEPLCVVNEIGQAQPIVNHFDGWQIAKEQAMNVFVIVAGVALLLGTSAPQAAPVWSPPVQLAPVQVLINLQFDGSIALDALGNSAAVWNANGVVQASFQTNGGPYSPALDISQAADYEEAIEPRVALTPQGGVIAIWTSSTRVPDQVPVNAIKSASKMANGAWSAPVVITSSSTAGPSSPRIAVDLFGNALAVWQSCEPAACVIRSASKSSTGGWSAAVSLSGANAYASSPQLALSPLGQAVVVWQSALQPRGVTVIQSASRRSAAGSWSAAVDLSQPAGVYGAKVAIDALGRSTAVWNQDGVINAALRASNGTWSAPVALSSGAVPSQRAPDVAMDLQGDAVAAWTEFDALNVGMGAVQVATRLVGAMWSSPTQVSTVDEDAGEPRVAMSPMGNMKTVAWVDNAQNGARVSTQIGHAAWALPTTLGNALFDTSVELSATLRGKARALWGIPFISPRGGQGWAPGVATFTP
jgi:hypothetical protein